MVYYREIDSRPLVQIYEIYPSDTNISKNNMNTFTIYHMSIKYGERFVNISVIMPRNIRGGGSANTYLALARQKVTGYM